MTPGRVPGRDKNPNPAGHRLGGNGHFLQCDASASRSRAGWATVPGLSVCPSHHLSVPATPTFAITMTAVPKITSVAVTTQLGSFTFPALRSPRKHPLSPGTTSSAGPRKGAKQDPDTRKTPMTGTTPVRWDQSPQEGTQGKVGCIQPAHGHRGVPPCAHGRHPMAGVCRLPQPLLSHPRGWPWGWGRNQPDGCLRPLHPGRQAAPCTLPRRRHSEALKPQVTNHRATRAGSVAPVGQGAAQHSTVTQHR